MIPPDIALLLLIALVGIWHSYRVWRTEAREKLAERLRYYQGPGRGE